MNHLHQDWSKATPLRGHQKFDPGTMIVGIRGNARGTTHGRRVVGRNDIQCRYHLDCRHHGSDWLGIQCCLPRTVMPEVLDRGYQGKCGQKDSHG